MGDLRELLNEQAAMNICSKLDHSWKALLPIQKKDEKREVLCICTSCHRESWVVFPEKGYARFLKDLNDGKIK